MGAKHNHPSLGNAVMDSPDCEKFYGVWVGGVVVVVGKQFLIVLITTVYFDVYFIFGLVVILILAYLMMVILDFSGSTVPTTHFSLLLHWLWHCLSLLHWHYQKLQLLPWKTKRLVTSTTVVTTVTFITDINLAKLVIKSQVYQIWTLYGFSLITNKYSFFLLFF